MRHRAIENSLRWLIDHSQEDRRVEIGCYDCRENLSLMAMTALTCFLREHDAHRMWMRFTF